jgi:hypothetical protein
MLANASLCNDYLSLHQQCMNQTDPDTKEILMEMTKDAKEMYDNAKSKM